MSNFHIFSDGACDITLEQAKKLDVTLIPFYVSLDGETYFKEQEQLSLEKYYETVLANKLYPKTSLPSVQDYIDAFMPYIENNTEVICFTITDSLSGSVHSAYNAKDIILETNPDAKIHIINSRQATGTQLLIIHEAVRMAKDGYSADKIVEVCEKLKKKGGIVFMIGDLENMRRGGRIGKLTAMSGAILNIKPIVNFEEGEVRVGGIARNRKNGLKKIVAVTKNIFEKKNYDVNNYKFIVGFSAEHQEVATLRDLCLDFIPRESFFKPYIIGAAITAHTGSHTTGLCYSPIYESEL